MTETKLIPEKFSRRSKFFFPKKEVTIADIDYTDPLGAWSLRNQLPEELSRQEMSPWAPDSFLESGLTYRILLFTTGEVRRGVAGMCLNSITGLFDTSPHIEDQILERADERSIHEVQMRTMHEHHELRQKYE